MQFPAYASGGTNYQRTVSHRFCHARVLFRPCQQGRCAHSGTSFSKGCFVGIHDAQAQEPKVAHGARRSSDIERIARRYQDYAEVVEIRRSWQDGLILTAPVGSLSSYACYSSRSRVILSHDQALEISSKKYWLCLLTIHANVLACASALAHRLKAAFESGEP